MTNPAMNATWEQALNYFQDGDAAKPVPDRATLMGTKWLKWDVWGAAHGGKAPSGWDWTMRSWTDFAVYWAVASADYGGLDKPMNDFYGPMRVIIESLLNGSNPVAQPWTFDRAHNALNGTKEILVEQSKNLKLWQDKVGNKGDDFQGAGAGAFWKVLDGLIDKCDSCVRQLGVRDGHAWNALVDARGGDNPATPIVETRAGLQWAIDTLAQAYRDWLAPASSDGFSLKNLGRPLDGTNLQLAWPGGALQAVFNSTAFQADLDQSRSPSGSTQEHYPRSRAAGFDARSPGFWDRIEDDAKVLWQDHMYKTLDTAAARVVQQLDPNYRTASTYLPTIIAPPPKVDLAPKPPPGPPGPPVPPPPKVPPPPGSQGGPKGPPPPGSSGGRGGPKPPPLGGGDPLNPNGNKGPNGTNGPNGPVPNLPNLPNNPNNPNGSTGPGPLNPNAQLKAPTGSHVGPDGVVRGPDGKPLLDRNGKQVVVPPGSRVSPDGDILGPKGEKLTEKDRLQRPEVVGGQNGESELDRYLKSLRGTNSPTMPALLNNSLTPPPNLQIGGSGSGISTVPGVTGLNGQSSNGQDAPSPPAKTVTTEGGPSLMKNQSGNGGTQNGMGGVPFYPPMAGGAGAGGAQGENKGERDRTTWLAEDEETWGTDPKLPPSVLGARRRRPRVAQSAGFGSRNHGQGGNDGRLAGGSAAPDHGRVEGSA